MSASLGLMLERQPVRPSVFSSLPLRHQRQQQGPQRQQQQQQQSYSSHHPHRLDKKGVGANNAGKHSNAPSSNHSLDGHYHPHPQSSNISLQSSASLFSGLNDDSSFGSYMTLPPMTASPGPGANRASLSPGALPTRVHTANPLQGRGSSSSSSSKGTRGTGAGAGVGTGGGINDLSLSPSPQSPSQQQQQQRSRSRGRSNDTNVAGTSTGASTSAGTNTSNGSGAGTGVSSKREKKSSPSSTSPSSNIVRGALARVPSPSTESVMPGNNGGSEPTEPGHGTTTISTSQSSPEFVHEEMSVGSSNSRGQGGGSSVRVGTTGTPGVRKSLGSPLEATSRRTKK